MRSFLSRSTYAALLEPPGVVSYAERMSVAGASPEPPDRAAPEESAWLRSYRRALGSGAYDELLDASGAPRPPWRKILSMLEAMGEPELEKSWEHARALLREHGVSYDAYGDPQGTRRPWSLSPLPDRKSTRLNSSHV